MSGLGKIRPKRAGKRGLFAGANVGGCSTEGCGRMAIARGICGRCYLRWWRTKRRRKERTR